MKRKKRRRVEEEGTVKGEKSKKLLFLDSMGQKDYSTEEIVDVSSEEEAITVTSAPASWMEKYAPRNADAVAVHKAKLKEVRQWLSFACTGRSMKRLLILTGPAGSGKTATLLALRDEVGFEVCEWTNPQSGDLPLSVMFEDFLAKADRYAPLDFGQAMSKRVILLEDLPNTFSSSPAPLAAFRRAVQQHLTTGVHPIILIISETELRGDESYDSAFNPRKLLGPEMLEDPRVDAISFNPISKTSMLRVLRSVLLEEHMEGVLTEGAVLKLASMGDVRSALNGLQFSCRQLHQHHAKHGKRKRAGRADMEPALLDGISGRDSAIGLFHAVGRVVHNKRLPGQQVDMPEHMAWAQRAPSSVAVERVLDESGVDASTFLLCVYENYLPSTTELAEGDQCASYLSDTCIIGPSEAAATVGISGVLFALPQTLVRKVYKIYYPTLLKTRRVQAEIEDDLLSFMKESQLSMGKEELLLEYLPWLYHIRRPEAIRGIVTFHGLERGDATYSPYEPREAMVKTGMESIYEEVDDEIEDFE